MSKIKREDIIESIGIFCDYFARCGQHEPLFIPEYKIATEIQNLIKKHHPISGENLSEIIRIYNKIANMNHYNGSGWYDYKTQITFLVRSFGYEVNESSSNVLELIHISTVSKVMEERINGRKIFFNLELSDDENFEGLVLENTIFMGCYFSANFRRANLTNSIFLHCNLKTSDFSEADLTNATIQKCLVEGINLSNAKIDNLTFEENLCFGREAEISMFY